MGKEYLVEWYRVKLRHQFDTILPSDQNALQCLAVLLHLYKTQSHFTQC